MFSVRLTGLHFDISAGIKRHTERLPLSERIGKARAIVAAMGIRKGDAAGFDMKTFTDEGWGG